MTISWHFCHAQLFNYLQCQNLWESKPWLSKHMLTLSFNSYWSSLPQNSLAGHLRFLAIMKLSAKWPEIITVTTCDDETNVPYTYTSVIQLSALFTHREKKNPYESNELCFHLCISFSLSFWMHLCFAFDWDNTALSVIQYFLQLFSRILNHEQSYWTRTSFFPYVLPF